METSCYKDDVGARWDNDYDGRGKCWHRKQLGYHQQLTEKVGMEMNPWAEKGHRNMREGGRKDRRHSSPQQNMNEEESNAQTATPKVLETRNVQRLSPPNAASPSTPREDASLPFPKSIYHLRSTETRWSLEINMRIDKDRLLHLRLVWACNLRSLVLKSSATHMHMLGVAGREETEVNVEGSWSCHWTYPH